MPRVGAQSKAQKQDVTIARAEVTLPYLYAPRDYQLPIWTAMFEQEYLRSCLVWHRRAGKDVTVWNILVAKAMQRVGIYYHMLPVFTQARRVIWDAVDSAGRRFLDYIPTELIADVNNTEMKIKIHNGSLIQLAGSDAYDLLVGTNPVGINFSEYSIANPRAWDYLQPILAENGGWANFIYTPRGRNHGYELYTRACGNPAWFTQMLTIDDTKRDDGTRVVTEEAVAEARMSGMTNELIQQEFYCSFESAMSGAYYGNEMKQAYIDKRIGRIPVDGTLEVQTAWDIGIGDSTAIWLYQIAGREVRFIAYHENSGEGLPYYVHWLEQFSTQYKVKFGRNHAPHDIEVREFTTGKSRKEIAADMGFHFDAAPRIGVDEGIDQARRLFPYCCFDEERCRRGLDALSNYRKDYDETGAVWKAKPVHDWSSHGADAFRTFAVMFSPYTGFEKRRLSGKVNVADTDFDLFE